MQINAIAAVGLTGQLGIEGRMPWPRDAEDLEFFRVVTQSNVVVFGNTTFDSLFLHQPVWRDRMVLAMGREYTRIYDGGEHVGYWNPGVERILEVLGHKKLDLWVAGGQQIYQLWRPHVRRYFITKIDYGGKADTWMPDLWDQSL